MSRPMKCRVWNGEEMVYLPTMIVDDFSIGFTTEDEFYVDINTHHPRPDLEVTWSTGLTDKNGKEIFEGDILKWRGVDGYKVEFKNGAWVCSGWYLSSYEPKTLEVIGNVHENPELLK